MIKSFLILISFQILLFSSQQIILVVAKDFSASKADLEFYEDNKLLLKTEVNLGTNGLGWGLGEYKLVQKKDDPVKYEGDKKAPAGVFKLTNIFGYAYSSNYKLPYLHTDKELICVDDSKNNFYNHIIQAHGDEKSFEYMKRKDQQYKYGVTVEHNKLGVVKRGSCIFLHIEKYEGASTAGCTSMKEEKLIKIINALDQDKSPLIIQIPKSSINEIKKLFPQLINSILLTNKKNSL